jgi:hypothetical protein
MATVTNDLGADLHQLLPQCRQRPMLHLFGQSQSSHEVGEIIRQRVKLQPDLVVAELAPRQTGPLDGVLAFLDPLLRRAPLIVEGDNPFSRTAQISDDEADTRVQLVGMPFDLGNDAAFLVPRSGLIAEAGMETADMVWRTANRARQQMGDALLENLVRLEADGVQETLTFQKLINVRCSKGGIASEIAAQVPFPVALDYGFQNIAPAVGAMNVAGTQGTPFQIAKLVEQK